MGVFKKKERERTVFKGGKVFTTTPPPPEAWEKTQG